MSESKIGGSFSWSLFAPAAIGLVPAFVVGLLAIGKGEERDWAQHLVAGVVFAGLFAATFLGAWRDRRVATIGGIVGLVFTGAMMAWHGLAGFQLTFVFVGIIAGASYWFSQRSESLPVVEIFLVAVSSTLGVWAMSRLCWWLPLGHPGSTGGNLFILLITALVCVCLYTWRLGLVGRRFLLLDTVVLVLLAIAVVRTTDMTDNIVAAHHWSVLIGPAESVREGKSLLGQVPSQYGFLSILLLAGIPTASCYEALYWLQTVTLWISGAILYFVLRAWLAMWWWQVGAGILSIVGIAFFCGDLSQLSGPMLYPNVGPVRFVWVYLLLGWLFWRVQTTGSDTSSTNTLRIGTLLWLFGVIWSVESAVYVTAAWLPAASLLSMPAGFELPSKFGRIRALAQGIAVALLYAVTYLIIAGVIVWALYQSAYGRAPEWTAYWEYAVSFVGGESLTLLIDPSGPVWALLLLHTVLIAALLSVDGRGSLSLVWAAWGAFWSVSTYYTARSHPNNISNLGPVLLLVIGVVIYAIKHTSSRALVRPWIWVLMVTWMGGVLWLVGTNVAAFKRQFTEYRVNPRVDLLLPAQSDLSELVSQCLSVRAAPYSTIGINGFATTTIELTKAHPNWLPLRSLPLYPPLTDKRWMHYLDIYHGQPKSGWLLAPIYVERDNIAWLFDYIESRYTATDYRRNARWQAWYFEPRMASSPGEFDWRTRGVGAPIKFLKQFGGSTDSRLLTGSTRFFENITHGSLIGTTSGKAEMRLNFPANRLQATLAVRRVEGSSEDDALWADFVIYASQLDQPAARYERWRERITLPAKEKEVVLHPEIDGSGMATLFTVEIPEEFSGRMIAGWQNPDVKHVSRDSSEPVWIFPGGGDAIQLDEAALSRLLPGNWRPQQAWMRKGWIVSGGVELSPGGEIWLKAPDHILRMHGKAVRSDGVSGLGVNVTGLWYKGGRMHYYTAPTPEDRANSTQTFQMWSAEHGGWLVIAADNAGPWVPVIVKITEAVELR